MKKNKNIYLLRHSITDYNVQKRLFGSADIPLNDNGVKLVHNIKEDFKDKNIQGVISSDLLRAYQTGKIIADWLGVPLVTNKMLRERDQGIYEGLYIEDIINEVQDFSFDTHVEGRETVREFMSRTKTVFESIAREVSWDNYIIVTHNGVLKIFMSTCLKKRIRQWALCESKKVVYNNISKEWVVDE
jgi:broad specificity phosphatase PhoE